MAQCEHYEICSLDANPGEDLCILHSHRPKDYGEFQQALAEHRKKKPYNFQHFVFPGDANFRDATFTEWVSFFYAKFTERADFSHAKFAEGADFSHGNFMEGADFLDTTFTKNTKFFEATFTGWVNFSAATFNDWAWFGRATFTEDAFYDGAEFRTRAVFSNGAFLTGASFVDTTFNAGAEFDGTTFSKAAEFFRARFLGRTLFVSRKEGERTIPIFFGTEVSFRDVIVEPPDVLVFRDADLQKCRLQGTDLRKAEITGAIWPKIRGRCRVPRVGVYDEILLSKDDNRSRHHIERLYRELKQNFEDRKDYERAGDFHYGEKEMRRKNGETPLGRQVLLWLYWLVSGYGERCLRPLGWAVGLLTVCTAGYLRFGLAPAKDPALTLSCQDWPRAAHYSFRVMTLLKPDDLVPVGECARWVGTVESLLGPILIALFALALRQRLKR